MSGVCGHLRLDGSPATAGDVERQLAVLAHRGPDRRRSWTKGPLAFGHLLMRVSPEDLSCAQPLVDAESGLTLTADVRLDNRAELARALGLDAEAARDWPDSRFVLAAWKRWGADCLDKLLGDFALALWDARCRRLTLARDAMGQRPLYFHHGPTLLAFASEIKGLWALAEVPRDLDQPVLARCLVDSYLGFTETSAYRGIRMLQGGAAIHITEDGTASEWLYWQPRPDPAMINRSESDYQDAYREVLSKAVTCRLRGTRPAALIFSGGFDSGSIAALAGPTLQVQERRLIGLTSVLPDGPPQPGERDGRVWAERCAGAMPHLDLRCLTAVGRTSLDGLEQALHADDGMAIIDHHYAFAEFMSTAAAAGVRTIMDGHGGDYTLNPRCPGHLAFLLRRGWLTSFFQELRAHRRTMGLSLPWLLRRHVLRPLAPDWVADLWKRLSKRIDEIDLTRSVIRDDFAKAALKSSGFDPRDPRLTQPPDHRGRDQNLQELELVTRWQIVWGGNLAAAHGLELTRPYHDRRVVELALAIPEELYVQNGWERHIARTAMKNLLPPEFATRDRLNDNIAPDLYRRHKAIQPLVEAELLRLERSEVAGHMIDFARLRALLDLPASDPNGRFALSTALHGLFVARTLEWFHQPNRTQP